MMVLILLSVMAEFTAQEIPIGPGPRQIVANAVSPPPPLLG
jgi:hypothetical protein